MKNQIVKLMALLLALCIAFPCAAMADDFDSQSTIAAYWALVGHKEGSDTPANRLLTEVMDGAYAENEDSEKLAGVLALLSKITVEDLARFAGENQIPVDMVRHNYYIALANALDAEISLNPATEEKQRNLQIVLQLFLDARKDDDDISERERKTLRKTVTQAEVNDFAQLYQLPVSFVEFLIMDDDWDDDDWDDDDKWAKDANWDLTDWVDDDDVRNVLGDDAVITYDEVKEVLKDHHIDFDDQDDDQDDDRDDDQDDDRDDDQDDDRDDDQDDD